jgi:endonuclease G
MKYLNFLILCLFSLLSVSVSAQHFNFLPDTVDGHQIVSYTQFTLSYNETHEQADWVAYELDSSEATMKRKRCNCFKSDNKVVTKSANKNDYRASGFDLGHLCPAADNNMSDETNRESFLMSNISPQLPGFNREVWKKLEEWVRALAVEFDTIYVVTGPVFINNLGAIGKNKVTIPGYFYKALLRREGKKYHSIALLIPQLGASDDFRQYVIPVNALESITGIDFFPALPDNKENLIESQFQPNKWGL